MNKAPTVEMGNRVMCAVRRFEKQTGKTVKSIRLVRMDKPVIFHGASTDLVGVEVTIRG